MPNMTTSRRMMMGFMIRAENYNSYGSAYDGGNNNNYNYRGNNNNNNVNYDYYRGSTTTSSSSSSSSKGGGGISTNMVVIMGLMAIILVCAIVAWYIFCVRWRNMKSFVKIFCSSSSSSSSHDAHNCEDASRSSRGTKSPLNIASRHHHATRAKEGVAGAAAGGVKLTSAQLAMCRSLILGGGAGNHNRNNNHNKNGRELEEEAAIGGAAAQVFTIRQLEVATRGFHSGNVVGCGGFGSVFRATLADGRSAAIKRLDSASKQGDREFRVEVDMLSRLSSPYLVSLLGYCADKHHRLLVYEYMPNGNLQDHLHSDGSSGQPPILDWNLRLRIALDSACGLEYLHEGINPPVIHRDFKSSNILLDSSFNAKVSDFGLAKLGSDKVGGHVSTRVLGTHGYVAPEYALTGHLTTKSDVYSYGVVLLELLTGRVPIDMTRPAGEGVLVNWALPRLTNRDKLIEMVDPMLHGQFALKELIQVAAIAAMCVQPEADYRPLMTDVVQSLIPLVKQRKAIKDVIVTTPSYHHHMVTIKSSSIDNGSSGQIDDTGFEHQYA